jgi:hypothetical protein
MTSVASKEIKKSLRIEDRYIRVEGTATVRLAHVPSLSGAERVGDPSGGGGFRQSRSKCGIAKPRPS